MVCPNLAYLEQAHPPLRVGRVDQARARRPCQRRHQRAAAVAAAHHATFRGCLDPRSKRRVRSWSVPMIPPRVRGALQPGMPAAVIAFARTTAGQDAWLSAVASW